jgi:hypothetical protein
MQIQAYRRESKVAQEAKMTEPTEKRDAFKRLAERRTTAILERVRLLGNLSNPYAYEYSDEDVRKIFGTIDQELKATKAKFQANKRREFRLE